MSMSRLAQCAERGDMFGGALGLSSQFNSICLSPYAHFTWHHAASLHCLCWIPVHVIWTEGRLSEPLTLGVPSFNCSPNIVSFRRYQTLLNPANGSLLWAARKIRNSEYTEWICCLLIEQSYLNVSSKQICSKRILGKRQRETVWEPQIARKWRVMTPNIWASPEVASLRMQRKGLIQAASMEFRPEPHTQGGGWNVQLWGLYLVWWASWWLQW